MSNYISSLSGFVRLRQKISRSTYLLLAGTPIVWHIWVAFNKRTRVEIVAVKTVLFKHTESQLDPFFSQHRSLGFYWRVFAYKSNWQLDVLSGLLAASELEGPGPVPEDGVGGDDLDVWLVAGDSPGQEVRRRGAVVQPGGGQLHLDISQLNPTVGEVEDVPRSLCQDRL